MTRPPAALARQPATYRPDGWPLCPCCGSDELWSATPDARATDRLHCLVCFWSGRVRLSATMREYLELHP